MFKFSDLPGFADGFRMHDHLAKRFRPYAFFYPFLEFLLGLGYLSQFRPKIIYQVTAILMGFGSLGVIVVLIRKLEPLKWTSSGRR